MATFAELELQLQRIAPAEPEGAYALSVRLRLPESDADIDPLKGQAAPVRLDFAALRQLLYNPQAYGHLLTQNLLADPRAQTALAQARSAAGNTPLRVRLTIGGNALELHQVRWEALHEPQAPVPLFIGERIYFSRYLASADGRKISPRPRDALKALIAVANPGDLDIYRLAAVDVAGEVARAQQSLGDIPTTVLASTTAPVTLAQLATHLRERYDIVYLVGHGVLIKNEPYLFLDDAAGQTAQVAGRELAQRCAELLEPPRLVVLASCQSAGTATGGTLNAFGPLLAEAGVPAVLAMQGNVSKKTVELFMPTFFTELQRDGQIDRALAVARGMARAQPDAWMPVLFTRLAQGNLFHLDGDAVCPYPGLQAFTESEAGNFFGREALTTELLERLRQQPALLMVVGDSGSGKSSLVQAGVVPALRQGRLPQFNSTTWPVAIFTPNIHPLRGLAAAVTGAEPFSPAVETLWQRLQLDPAALTEAIAQRLTPSGAARLVVVIDQFEETFTLCHDEAERTAFIAALMTAVQAPPTSQNLTLICTLRADFYHRCAQYPALRTALEKHQTYIGAMSQTELRAAIEKPLRNRWALEPSLLEVVLSEVGTEPGALPLLSHVLRETWFRREGRLLTLKGYHAVGGLRQALTHTAEAVFARLTPAQQTLVQQIFLRLTEPGEGTGNGGYPLPDTRRRMALAEQPATAQPMLKILADARLIIASQEGVEVAHEALIRGWPRLRAWLDEDRAGLRLHHQLTNAAEDWARLGRDASALYRGTRLTVALEWQKNKAPLLSPLEAEFLAAAQAEKDREEQAREAQRQHELTLERERAAAESARAQEAEARAAEARTSANRLRTRNRLITGAVLVAVVLAVVAGVFGFNAQTNADLAHAANTQSATNLSQANLANTQSALNLAQANAAGTEASHNAMVAQTEEAKAKAQSEQALGLLLAPQAGQVLAKFPNQLNRATLLAIESLQHYPNADAHQALGETLALLPLVLARFNTNEVETAAVAVSPNGKWLVVGGCDKNFSGVAICEQGTARVWEAATGRELARMTHETGVRAVAFNPTGQWVVSGSEDGTARVWEAATGRELARMAYETGVQAVAFSPDGQWVVSGGMIQSAFGKRPRAKKLRGWHMGQRMFWRGKFRWRRCGRWRLVPMGNGCCQRALTQITPPASGKQPPGAK